MFYYFIEQKNEEHPCLIFDPEILLIEPNIDRPLIPLVPCQKFIYDKSVFSRTITSDWNLVCSKHWLIHVSKKKYQPIKLRDYCKLRHENDIIQYVSFIFDKYLD